MRKNLFLDTNVILDIILEREDFLAESKQILVMKDSDKVELYASALTLATTAYFAKKFGKDPRVILSKVLKWISVIDLRNEHFEKAILSDFPDFEDALQYFSAQEVIAIDYIITRNLKDFKLSRIPVFNPKQFIEYTQRK